MADWVETALSPTVKSWTFTCTVHVFDGRVFPYPWPPPPAPPPYDGPYASPSTFNVASFQFPGGAISVSTNAPDQMLLLTPPATTYDYKILVALNSLSPAISYPVKEYAIAEGETLTITATLTLDCAHQMRTGADEPLLLHSREQLTEERFIMPVGTTVSCTCGGGSNSFVTEVEYEWTDSPFQVSTTINPNSDWTAHGTPQNGDGTWPANYLCCTVGLAQGSYAWTWDGLSGYYHLRSGGGYWNRVRSEGTGANLADTVEIVENGNANQVFQYATWLQGSELIDWSNVRLILDDAGVSWPDSSTAEFADMLVGPFSKVVWLDGIISWPLRQNTNYGGNGEFDYGDACPVRLDELVALGPTYSGGISYTNPITNEWFVARLPFATSPINLEMDLVSLRAHLGDVGGDLNIPSNHDVDFTLYLPFVNATTRNEDPFELATVVHEEVDVDLSSPFGYRVSAWDGLLGAAPAGGGVGSTGSFDVTLAAGSAGAQLQRTLLCNLEVKFAHVSNPTAPCIICLPTVYWQLRTGADTPPACTMHGLWSPEDVFDWTQHDWADLHLTIPTGVTGTVTVQVRYRTFTVLDDHMSGAERATGFTADWSSYLTATYDLPLAASGDQHLRWCLSKAKTTWYPNLLVVDSVTITFPANAAGQTWTFHGLDLIHDAGTAERNAPATYAYAKLAQDYRVRDSHEEGLPVCGVVSAKVDGHFPALATVDTYQQFEREQGVGLINWIYSRYYVVDSSSAWGLLEFLALLTNAGNGFTWGISAANWAAWTTDADDNALGSLAPWCLLDANYRCVDGSAGWPVALGCGAWDLCAGVAYAPRFLARIGGGMQGRVRSGDDFLRNQGAAVPILRREAGDSWTPYVSVPTDEQGWFGAGYYLEVYGYGEGDSPLFWEWTTSSNVIERLYRRQWTSWTPSGRGSVKMAVDYQGIGWLASADGSAVYVQYRESPAATFSEAVTVVLGDYTLADIMPFPDGSLLVAATNPGDLKVYGWLSLDGGCTWAEQGVLRG